MNATPTDEVKTESLHPDGAGQHLRKAREALDLGRAEVAAGLYLSEQIITALEEDDHDALPGPVFVQGYLRKYARLLNIPEAPLLKAYSHQVVPQKHQKKNEGPLAGSPIKPEIRSNHTIVRLITWAIVFGLLALVAVWWQSDMRWPVGELGDKQPAVTQEAQPEHAFAPGLPMLESEAYQSEDEAGSQDLETGTDALNNHQAEQMQDEPSTTALPTTTNHALASTGITPVSGTTEIEVPAVVGVAPTQGLEQENTLGDAAEVASMAGQPEAPSAEKIEPIIEPPIDYANSIVIEFSEACWTEIRGSNKSYKLLGNMQAGKRHVIMGEPPYTFLLGNSSAVILTIKGKVFDLKAHTRGNIARFVLQAEDIPNA